MSLKAEALEYLEQRETHTGELQGRLDRWASEMLWSRHIGDTSTHPLVAIQQANIDADSAKRHPNPQFYRKTKGLPTGRKSQTKVKRELRTAINDDAARVELSVIYATHARPELLDVIRAEYLNMFFTATKPFRGRAEFYVYRFRDVGESLMAYRERTCGMLGISASRWRQLLADAHAAIGTCLMLIDDGLVDEKQLHRLVSEEIRAHQDAMNAAAKREEYA